MPFPEPETALASTIDREVRENLIREFIARPGASWRASPCFQSLTPRLNNLRIFSTTYRPFPADKMFFVWFAMPDFRATRMAR
jgi:hypothetical protein